jgi:hypothetical protein
MAKSTATLTQSDLLAVLLQRQRKKDIELVQRWGHSKQMRFAFFKRAHLALGASSRRHC